MTRRRDDRDQRESFLSPQFVLKRPSSQSRGFSVFEFKMQVTKINRCRRRWSGKGWKPFFPKPSPLFCLTSARGQPTRTGGRTSSHQIKECRSTKTGYSRCRRKLTSPRLAVAPNRLETSLAIRGFLSMLVNADELHGVTNARLYGLPRVLFFWL